MATNPKTAAANRTWLSRLVEKPQLDSVRANRLGSIGIFSGFHWPDLEFAAEFLAETLVERGTRKTVQGRPSSRLWIIADGQALLSADARPLRVATRGDAVGGMTRLYGRPSRRPRSRSPRFKRSRRARTSSASSSATAPYACA